MSKSSLEANYFRIIRRFEKTKQQIVISLIARQQNFVQVEKIVAAQIPIGENENF